VVHLTLDTPVGMTVADLNGDGKPDIAVTADTDGIAIFYGR
jgi:hypothetical protein